MDIRQLLQQWFWKLFSWERNYFKLFSLENNIFPGGNFLFICLNRFMFDPNYFNWFRKQLNLRGRCHVKVNRFPKPNYTKFCAPKWTKSNIKCRRKLKQLYFDKIVTFLMKINCFYDLCSKLVQCRRNFNILKILCSPIKTSNHPRLF